MKVLVHFCICVEHDSLNVSGSEKCFEQDLHKKNTHTIFTLYIFPNTAILYVGKKEISGFLKHAAQSLFIFHKMPLIS